MGELDRQRLKAIVESALEPRRTTNHWLLIAAFLLGVLI